MTWDEWDNNIPEGDQPDQDSYLNFDFSSLLCPSPVVFVDACCPEIVSCVSQDYYKILEVDYDATDDAIRSNYIRLALKWHPDKKKGQDAATSRFQEINEAYQVLSDPAKRREYDKNGMLYVYDCNLMDYLNRYKSLILTCNGLGMKQFIW
ncbi:uncharacterized J domain-containing protein C3E7.11c-like [Neltuma alba]|uniref:uncharacterized J domain-containing protein C3E7.11c-like n=1 Tax=Neltuma alba TaxID=207710 RepID=UPI0010A3C131|nr:uncharacterized J domain-containing protein C3E7.11c-like [Prosopis alba]